MKKQTHIHQHLEELSSNDSESAFKYLYYNYADRVMRYILMYVKSRESAEELVSDVFFALWENRKALSQVNNLDAWIYKMAKFKALNYLRNNKLVLVDLDQIPLQIFACTETSPEEELISKESIERVNQVIEQLPSRTKLAFKLVREDGMKYKEAAEHLGISVKTLEAQLTAAMKAITHTLSLAKSCEKK